VAPREDHDATEQDRGEDDQRGFGEPRMPATLDTPLIKPDVIVQPWNGGSI
jgi:hypothetical protein